MTIRIRPCELRDANAFVERLHRHHKPVVGHRFSLAAWETERLCGVAIVGRPVARAIDQRRVLEVTRLCTDGTKNACSALYAAAARVGREMGYAKIQTYILDEEPGTSLRAAGWNLDGRTDGGVWVHTDKQRRDAGTLKVARARRTDQPMTPKQRWAKALAA